jgi:hypothetical protein
VDEQLSVEHRITKIETALFGVNGTTGVVEKLDNYIKSCPVECIYIKEKGMLEKRRTGRIQGVLMVITNIGTLLGIAAILMKMFGLPI